MLLSARRRDQSKTKVDWLYRQIQEPNIDAVDQLFIDPVECIDCGACVPVCPVSAIFALDDLPEKWHSYIEKNSNYVDGGKFQPDKYSTA